jgi:hypothetical protein
VANLILPSLLVEKIDAAVENIASPVETVGNLWGKIAIRIRIAKCNLCPWLFVLCVYK